MVSSMEVPSARVVIVVMPSGCIGVTFAIEDSYQEAAGYILLGWQRDRTSLSRGWMWEKRTRGARGREEMPQIGYLTMRGENLQPWRQAMERVPLGAKGLSIDEVAGGVGGEQGYWEPARESVQKDDIVNEQIGDILMCVPKMCPGYPQMLPISLAASDWLDECPGLSAVPQEAVSREERWGSKGSFLRDRGDVWSPLNWPPEDTYISTTYEALGRFMQRDFTVRRTCKGPEVVRDNREITEEEGREFPNLHMGGRGSKKLSALVELEAGFPHCRRYRKDYEHEGVGIGTLVGTLIFPSEGYWDLKGINAPIRWRGGRPMERKVEQKYRGGELIRLRSGKFVLDLKNVWPHVQRIGAGIHPGFARHGGWLGEFRPEELQLGEIAEERRSRTRRNLVWDGKKRLWVPVGSLGGPARRSIQVLQGAVSPGDEGREGMLEYYSSPTAHGQVRRNFGEEGEGEVIERPAAVDEFEGLPSAAEEDPENQSSTERTYLDPRLIEERYGLEPWQTPSGI